jgi:rhamnose transport system permease protein
MSVALSAVRMKFTSWEWLLGLFAVLLILTASVTTIGFVDSYNLESSLSRMAAKALLALPLAFLIIAREIDISVASIAGLCGIAFGLTTQSGGSTTLAITVALIIGAACGAVNGFLVAVLKLPSLVVTLGSLALFRGLCYVLVGGTPISGLPPEIVDFANGAIPGTFIPLAIVPFVFLASIAAIILHRTAFGRRLFAIGGNPDTARYAGVKNNRMVFELFVASGLVSALAGLIQIGITSSAAPDSAVGFELDAITVVFLGGVSFLGGTGKMSGVLWAIVVIVTVRSMLQLQNYGAYGQAAVVGLILIASLLLGNLALKASAVRATRRMRAIALASEGSSAPHHRNEPLQPKEKHHV